MKKALTGTIIFIFIGLLTGAMATAAADVSKVAIIPFKVNADRDLSFLRTGIVDMLSTRLSHPGTVEIIDSATVSSALGAMTGRLNEKAAREIGERLGARYVLFGSLTSIGKAISLDARTVDVLGKKPAASYFVQADTLGAVIPKINRLAGDINQQLFGITAPTASPSVASSETAQRINPEKLLTQPSTPATGSPLQPVSPVTGSQKGIQGQLPFVQPVQSQTGMFWRSRTFKRPMHGIAMGDVDGDGRTETVVITDRQVFIYRVERRQLVKVGETKKSSGRYLVGVDIGDMNGNGRSEIFVTALNIQKNRVKSQVFEYDGSTYRLIVKSSPWYYRISKSPGEAPVLLGQKPIDADPFKSAVYEMQWDGTGYKPGTRLVPGKKSNALGCAVGNILNDGKRTIAAFSDGDAIQVFDTRGELLVTEDDNFGGNLLSVNLPIADPGNPPPVIYLPLRLIISDLNNDGKNELVTVRSEELTGKHLSRLRVITKGQFVGLTWDGAGLGETWKTRKLSGRIADFAVGDIDGDGIRDLVAILVAKEGRIVGMKPRVNIIAYSLGVAEK